MNDNPIRRAVDTRLSGLAFTPQMQADTLRPARLCNQPPHMRRKLSYSLAFALLALLLAALYLYNKTFTDPKPKKKKH